MTATITSIASDFAVGNRQYCFHGRTSTVAAGTLQTARAVWWFASTGGTVNRRHHGLEWVISSHTDGERIDLLVVDEDGTAEWATHATTTVGSSYDFTCYIADAGNGGSDANTGLTAGSPKLTWGAINTLLRANWVTDGEHLVVVVGDFSVTSPSGGHIWNHCTTSTGNTALEGRLTWYSAAGSTITITDDSSGAVTFNGSTSPNHGFYNAGVSVVGPYTVGGAGHFATLYQLIIPSVGTGYNFGMRDCTAGGARDIVGIPTSGVSIGERANGSFDWITAEGVTFGDVASYHLAGGPIRYHGLHDCTFGDHNGDSTGSSWRGNRVQYCSHSGNTFDRSGSTWKANLWRINGGENLNAEDNAEFVSVHDCHLVDGTEGFEIDQDNSSNDRYSSDIWFHACSSDPDSTGTQATFLGVNNGGGSVGQDVTNLRVTNCWAKSPGRQPFLSLATNGSSTTPKIHSVRLEGCSHYQTLGGQFGSGSTIMVRATGNGANYDNGALVILSNYGYCAETSAAGGELSSWMAGDGVADAKISTSDYNVCARVASANLTWLWPDSLATWQGATAHDDNSVMTQSAGAASHNFTSITEGSIDMRPASGSGHQIGTGMPGLLFADAGRYLRDPSAPNAGAWEDAGGTLMDDPDFGGGAGSYPNGQTDGFCTYS